MKGVYIAKGYDRIPLWDFPKIWPDKPSGFFAKFKAKKEVFKLKAQNLQSLESRLEECEEELPDHKSNSAPGDNFLQVLSDTLESARQDGLERRDDCRFRIQKIETVIKSIRNGQQDHEVLLCCDSGNAALLMHQYMMAPMNRQ